MAYDLPTAWKMDGLELSIEQKLNYLAAHVAALEAAGGGSTVSVTAEYTEQTYNNKLATITVDNTATKIFAPKVTVTPVFQNGTDLGTIKIGNSTNHIYAPLGGAYIEEDIDGTVGLYSATWQDLYDTTALCAAISVQQNENDWYYLEKVWVEYDNEDNPTYYAKFGTKTYYASGTDDPLLLVTT